MRVVVPILATLGALAVVLGAASVVVGIYFVRRVLTVVHARPDDVEVLAVDAADESPTVTLRRTTETEAPGRYGLWLDGGAGHARLGEVLRCDDRVVVRRLDGVDDGRLRPGPARWNQYYFAGTPASALGVAHHDVVVETELGPMPAWHVPAGDGDTWAVLVHGRGAARQECLRAVPPLHRLGLPVLVPTYRNDVGVPPGPDGRYRLGDEEWRDVEAAMRWAVDRGARRFVLCGWSLGGAIVLATASRAALAQQVTALVLDAPVVDWRSVLDHHCTLYGIPVRVNRIGQRVLRSPRGCRVLGLTRPIDLDRLDWVARAGELRHPTLLVHSDADEYVPNGPSLALARARPDLVRVEPWAQGRHTKEWNTDPARWERAVQAFVAERLSS